MAEEKTVFVTVGTTSFDHLIETISSKALVTLFEKLGYRCIVLQIGRGAGSVLETLQAGRPLIVVINELLMDNHQIELASQLAEDGHLYYATCSTLEATLRERNLSELKPFPPGKPELFSSFLDKEMGFSHS
ncbi:UDP-N-acetylglucosamine transferase subunit ALG13-like isoform X2 [Oculina patagonica]